VEKKHNDVEKGMERKRRGYQTRVDSLPLTLIKSENLEVDKTKDLAANEHLVCQKCREV